MQMSETGFEQLGAAPVRPYFAGWVPSRRKTPLHNDANRDYLTTGAKSWLGRIPDWTKP